MTQEALQDYILKAYPKLSLEPLAHGLTFITPVEALLEFLTFLKKDEALAFDNLMCLTAVDEIERMDVVYHLSSYRHRHLIGVKAPVKGANPKVPSVTSLWPGANWHEREVYDLFGVVFTGHPDLRRIMMPDEWEGHPMRKQYAHWNLTPLPDDVTEVTKDYPLVPPPLR